jgi:hypothetical protein
VLAVLLINHIDHGTLLAELIGYASAYAVGPTSHDDYFIFEHNNLYLYHQHNPSFRLCKGIWIATNHGINLIRSNGLSILTDMQTVAVYHFRNLFRPHPSILGCEAIKYGFFYFHGLKHFSTLFFLHH